MMNKVLKIAAGLAVSIATLAGCGSKYETVKGDPMDTKIYTLDNGLKVYMTVNLQEPRLQTYIAVNSGGKNDPADNTGLAHYLEHLMFKGTPTLGTSDYEAEKPLLDTIEALYNIYRTKTDEAERRAIYHVIDSISNVASQYAIPNEYDKAMALIGSTGSNAFTSNDVTCYQEDIPSNQVENWAKIQSDRFKNMVIRGFHTELEAVYEEKNMGLNDDGEKAIDALDSMLFAGHPYGTQTVIGTQEHLKNPSITAIKKQFETYYVPNNCAICVSGDFDPDEFVAIIERYFGDWKPNPDLPRLTYETADAPSSPKSKDVYGTEAEFVALAWRYPGNADADAETAEIVSSILYNGQAGLIDLDVNQGQRTLASAASSYGRADWGMLFFIGYPTEGQSLEEVRAILLEEAGKLRDGDFDESLVTSAVNNYKLNEMRSLERNGARAMKFVDSFINGETWGHSVGKLGRLEKLDKADIVAWANKYLAPESYAVVYKHLGIDPDIKKIDAPQITPIATNRDKESAMLTDIRNCEPAPIEPVFVNYDIDMAVADVDGLELLHKQNAINDIATVEFRYDIGTLNDPALPLAFDYVSYLGTEDTDAEEFASRMYALACSFGASVDDGEMRVAIRGLSENIGKAIDLVEDLYANAKGDDEILETLKGNEFKSRLDNKLNQNACRSALNAYVLHGPEYVQKTVLSNDALEALTSDELLEKVRSLSGLSHRILYYGPQPLGEVRTLLSKHHGTSGELKPLTKLHAPLQSVDKAEVLLAKYDARQFNYIQYSNRGEAYDPSEAAAVRLFNEYFGGGMNGVVFQEMREARALAYSAGARLLEPSSLNDSYCFYATIGSQNDKLRQAVETFDDIINDMPQSERGFDIAKAAILARLRTDRVTGMSVLYSYLADKELGLDKPITESVFKAVQDMEMSDLMAAHEKWIKGRTYRYGILGDASDLDMGFLRSLGPVRIVESREIFGY